MSTVIIVTPLVIAAWPSITAAVTAAVGTMGFALASSGGGRAAACDHRQHYAR